MHRIRKRLTYANVMSSIAVFVVMGGAAFAASQLPKNSVGTKQLKKNAVNSSKVKNHSLTGNDINLSSLGTVPSATSASHASSADSATNAANAANAGNANTVGGNSVKKIFYRGAETSPTQTILSLNGLTLTATCTANELAANATTSVANTVIHSSGVAGFPTPYYVEIDAFSPGENFDFLEDSLTESDSVQGSLTYTQPGGAVVTVVYMAEEGGFETSGCAISGYAIG